MRDKVRLTLHEHIVDQLLRGRGKTADFQSLVRVVGREKVERIWKNYRKYGEASLKKGWVEPLQAENDSETVGSKENDDVRRTSPSNPSGTPDSV